MKIEAKFSILALTTILSGCIAGPEKYNAIGANKPIVEAYRINTFSKESASTISGFADIANGTISLTPGGTYAPKTKDGKEDWRPIVDAGVYYVDNRCLAYLDAIFGPTERAKAPVVSWAILELPRRRLWRSSRQARN